MDNNWIKVRNKKPPEGVLVLFFSKKRDVSIGYTYKGNWFTPNEITRWFPTHWQPIIRPEK